jgi:hypothetical protein
VRFAYGFLRYPTTFILPSQGYSPVAISPNRCFARFGSFIRNTVTVVRPSGVIPCLQTRVEKPRGIARLWVNRSNVGAFEGVAGITCQTQIIVLIIATVRDGNDVVDLEAREADGLRHPTVFTTITCPISNTLFLPFRETHSDCSA